MAWSSAQDQRDQDAQRAWVDSWAGWDRVPAAYAGEGWNELHQDGGGGRLADDGPMPWSSGIPERFWDPTPEPASWVDQSSGGWS